VEKIKKVEKNAKQGGKIRKLQFRCLKLEKIALI